VVVDAHAWPFPLPLPLPQLTWLSTCSTWPAVVVDVGGAAVVGVFGPVGRAGAVDAVVFGVAVAPVCGPVAVVVVDGLNP
jgi:hypothetical protein